MVFPVEAVCMATLQQQISDKFLAKLAESNDIDAAKIEQLKNLLADTPEHAGSEPADQRLGRLTESWRSTGIERDPQKLF
jgi:hypothetical protein